MLPSGALETFGHGLLPRPKSGSMVLWRPGSGVVSVIPVGIGRSIDAWGLVGHLGPCWCHVGACGPCCCWGCADLGGLSCHQDLVTSRPELHSRSMVLLQLGSMVMSMACVSIKVIGTMAVLNWPYHDWLCPSLDTIVRELVLLLWGELTPTLRKDDPTPHRGMHLTWNHPRADPDVWEAGEPILRTQEQET